jgi:hypothetical protein
MWVDDGDTAELNFVSGVDYRRGGGPTRGTRLSDLALCRRAGKNDLAPARVFASRRGQFGRIRSFRRINYSLVKAFETASGFSCSHLR